LKALFSLLFFVELTWLLVDMASGYLMHGGVSFVGGLSLGAMFRFLVLGFLFSIVLSSKGTDKWLPLGMLAFCSLFAMIHVIGGRDDLEMIQKTSRLMLAPLFYLVIRDQISRGYLRWRGFLSICIVNAVVLLGNLYLTFFRVGFSQYGLSETGFFVGGSGYFYAGNEVGGTLIALLTLLLAANISMSMFRQLALIGLFVAGSIGLLSRTALGGTVILVVWALFLTRPKIAFGVLTILVGTMAAAFQQYWPYIEAVIDRWKHFAGEFGVWIVILGGAKRLGNIGDYLESLRETPTLLLYGEGWVGETENNVFDLLDAFGIWGLCFYLIWLTWAANLYLSLRDKRFHSEKSIVLVGMILLILISAFAGHILQSAMLAPFIAMMACTPYIVEMRAENRGTGTVMVRNSPEAPRPAGMA
jgi:hypothetical protein